MKKQKLVFVITKSFWGGAQKYVYDLATNLPQTDFEISVIAGGDGPLMQKLREKNIRAIQLPHIKRDIGSISEIKSFFSLIKLLRQEKPDIVHLNSSKIAVIGGIAAKLAGAKKVIFTSHGWPFNEDRPWIVRIFFKFLLSFGAIFQDKIIAVSEKLVTDAQNIPFVAPKMIVIHNGIDLANSNFLTKEEARNFFTTNYSLPTTHYLLATIAELTNNKGQKYAIEALSLIKDLPFIFVIIGEGELRADLEALIKEKGMEEKIILAGKIDNAAKYLPAFDMFLLTSITEALGFVILEAGMASLPVVATSVGGVPEIITNNGNGLLVENKNPESIKSAIEKLFSDSSLRTRLGSALNKTIHDKFSFEKMLEKTMEVYET